MFAFDEENSTLGVTPEAYRFILEYMTQAKGDYVKVWFYGLSRCFIPGENMTIEKVSAELGMKPDDVQAAFRYWERRGLIQRISDQPPAYRYKNVLQQMASGTVPVDSEYENFEESFFQTFGNKCVFSTVDIQTFYEWKKKLDISSEVIITVIHYLFTTKGKNFSMEEARKIIEHLADNEELSMEVAEAVLSRNQEVYNGTNEILKIFNYHRKPTEPELDLYHKWTHKWNFTLEAIEKACEETVKSRNPTFAYLDAILKRIHEKSGSMTASEMEKEQKLYADVKDFLYTLGAGNVTDDMVKLYQELQSLYPKEVLQLAARTCARKGGKLQDVVNLLYSWTKRGLKTEEEIRAWISKVDEQNSFIRELREKWGLRNTVSATDRTYLEKWENEWGFTRELIKHAATYAAETEKPFTYLDRILSEYNKKGIRTPEAAEKEHNSHITSREPKPNPAANFSQRKWEDDPDEMERFMKRPIKL